ncbi:MAG: hypothetical protein ACRCZ2_04485 [Fusobacteriaceae bacterium]
MRKKLSVEKVQKILVENIDNYGFGDLSNLVNDYLNEMFVAFKMIDEGEGNHISELLDINRRFENIKKISECPGQPTDESKKQKIDDIQYVLNYDGFWNKDYFYKKIA